MSFGDFNKPFRPNRTDFDWLSRDEAEVDAYVADDKCGFIITTQMWLDCLHGFGEIARADLRARIRKELPVYLLGGEKDPVTRMGEGMKSLAHAYAQAGLTDISLHLYPDGRHESFNETNRKQVTDDLVHWLLRDHRVYPSSLVFFVHSEVFDERNSFLFLSLKGKNSRGVMKSRRASAAVGWRGFIAHGIQKMASLSPSKSSTNTWPTKTKYASAF
jgi:hypothetical protein